MTRRGWAVLVTSGGFFVVARVIDAIEFYILGATFTSLVLLSLIHSRTVRIGIDVDRSIQPPRVHVDAVARVELAIRNTARRRLPAVLLHDDTSGTRGAMIVLDSLVPGGTSRVAYRLPTTRRGILDLGPLQATVVGPLGLTTTTIEIPCRSRVTVFPRIDPIQPAQPTSGSDPMAGAIHPNTLSHGGEDFYALRRYVIGDDLRRVHWPSTARHDELMVRQEELPWQGRTTVLIDQRSTTTSPESLELIISAAASIVNAHSTRQDLIRLVGSDGYDSGFAAGHAHVMMILEHLAQATVSDPPGASTPPGASGNSEVDRAFDHLVRGSTGGALVVIGAKFDRGELEHLARLENRFGSVALVRFMASGEVNPDERKPGSTVTITDDLPFIDAWNSAVTPMQSQRPGRVAR